MHLTLHFGPIAPDDPALAGLIARHAAESARHYPAESNHHLDGPALAAQGAILFAARRDLDGPACAMGGYAPLSATEAEIKSMRDVGRFLHKAWKIYSCKDFINDASGSLCEIAEID